MLLADVDEPLPPTENVLSGFEEKFEPGKDGNEGEEGEDGGDKEGGEEEEEAEEKPVIEVKTASYDHRFPATNQVSLPVHHICPTLASLKLPTSPFLQPNLLQGALRPWCRRRRSGLLHAQSSCNVGCEYSVRCAWLLGAPFLLDLKLHLPPAGAALLHAVQRVPPLHSAEGGGCRGVPGVPAGVPIAVPRRVAGALERAARRGHLARPLLRRAGTGSM